MNSIDPNEKKRLFSLFENMSNEDKGKIGNRTQNSEVLLVDGLNAFIRAYSVMPSMNEDGLHTGGIAGFLKSIGYAIKLLSPTRCVIVFDGNGGSMKRRKIYPQYKDRRKTKIRLNRAYTDISTADLEQKNLKAQLMRSIHYLDCLPTSTMAIDHIEADDSIAYIAQQYYKDSNVTIMSADKDFLQLASSQIKIWSPTKKKLYGCADVLNEYGIGCKNFIWYRVLEGDESDNIDGIAGAGLKTIIKCFPFFAEDRRIELDEIYTHCENNQSKYKLYRNILENKNIVERNYTLMQLKDTEIQSFSQLRINEILDVPVKKLDRFSFSKLITEDKMWNNIPNYQVWLNESFGKLETFVR
jgi:5'-3' exonuclease